MRILVLTDRFTPEIAAPSFRLMEHAKVWQELGHQVTVVTCVPNFPRGRVFPGYRNALFQEEVLEGVPVLRVWSYLAPNEGTVRRTLDYVSYMVSAVLQYRRYPEFDVVLASSPPFFVALAGFALARLRRCPWVFEIRDLWPASIRAVGVSAGHGLALVERVELGLYRDADRVLALTHAFRDDLVGRGIPAEKIDVVTNGVDAGVFHPGAVTFPARARLGVPDSAFLAGYVGTIGLAHGLGTLLDVAERLRDDPRFRFLLMGEGAQRRQLEEEARRRSLDQVIFRDFAPHHEIPSYLAALDASVVHLRQDPVFRTVIPSKIFESMAMGVPLVMAVEGESARIVGEEGAGVCVPSGDATAIAEALRALADDPRARRAMGVRGREAVLARYARSRLAEAALETLERACQAAEARR